MCIYTIKTIHGGAWIGSHGKRSNKTTKIEIITSVQYFALFVWMVQNNINIPLVDFADIFLP